MERIKHVSLFEDRHLFPIYVKDSVFPGKKKYHVKDREGLRRTATESLSRWKSEGFTSIYVYLSGLNSAVRALESAAWTLGLYLRVYEYSYSQNEWLPDLLEPFEDRSPHPFTPREELLWKREQEFTSAFQGREEQEFIFYVSEYTNWCLRLKKETLSWKTIKEAIKFKYSGLNNELIDAMEFYLFPDQYRKTHSKQEIAELEKEDYNTYVQQSILQRRADGGRVHVPEAIPFSRRDFEKRGLSKGELLDRNINRVIHQDAKRGKRGKRKY